jgi:DNA replication protein DnaC
LSPYSNQIDNLLEEATRHQMTLREALAWLCAAEIARKDSSVFEMAMRMARFPCVRTPEGFEFEAQPSIDPGVIRELATCRWIGHGDNLVLLGPPGVGKTHLEVGPWGENRSAWATACCSARPLH